MYPTIFFLQLEGLFHSLNIHYIPFYNYNSHISSYTLNQILRGAQELGQLIQLHPQYLLFI
jgi:hypothetical protein